MKAMIRMRFGFVASVLAVFVMAVSTSALADHPRKGDRNGNAPVIGNPVVVDADELLALLSKMEQQAVAIERANHENGHGSGKIHKGTERLQKQIQRMRQKIRRAPQAGQVGYPAAQQMTPQQFSNLNGAVRRAYYKSAKLEIIREAARYNWFSVDQLRTLSRNFYYGSDKVEIAATLYSRLVDPQNFYVIYSDLQPSQARALRQRVANMQPAQPNPDRGREGKRMNPREFKQFMATLRQTQWSSSKMELVADVARYNAFTTSQVTEILRLFPYSSEKVKIATMLYPKVVDPRNFYQVVAQLPYESDRRKLRRQIARL